MKPKSLAVRGLQGLPRRTDVNETSGGTVLCETTNPMFGVDGRPDGYGFPRCRRMRASFLYKVTRTGNVSKPLAVASDVDVLVYSNVDMSFD